MEKAGEHSMGADKAGLDVISSFLDVPSSLSFPTGFETHFPPGSSSSVATNVAVPHLAGFGVSPNVAQTLGTSLSQPAPGTPAAELRANIQTAQRTHLPQLASLAQAVLDGYDRAYDADVDPNKTAKDYNSLAALAAHFHEFLRETGVGALPILEPPKPAAGDDMELDFLAEPVPSVPEDELRTALNAEVDARYARKRRITEHAGTVASLLRSASASGG